MSGRVQERLDLGKGHDFLEPALDLPAAHPQDGAVQVDVLAPGELLVKTGAHLQERSHPAPHGHPPLGGFRDAGEHFEEGGLAGPVPADDPQNFPRGDFQGHPPQGPDGVRGGGVRKAAAGVSKSQEGPAQKPGEAFPQGAVGAVTAPEVILLPQVVNGDGHGRGGGHRQSL